MMMDSSAGCLSVASRRGGQVCYIVFVRSSSEGIRMIDESLLTTLRIQCVLVSSKSTQRDPSWWQDPSDFDSPTRDGSYYSWTGAKNESFVTERFSNPTRTTIQSGEHGPVKISNLRPARAEYIAATKKAFCAFVEVVGRQKTAMEWSGG